MAKKRQAEAEGAVLHHAIMPALLPWADRLGVAAPEPIAR
jgi:hypothetical protein